jgi:hypothetical protein
VYDSHSIWGEYTYPIEDGWDVTAGAKLGYVISADVIIKEANVGMEYKWLNRLTFSAKLTVGNSSRDYSSYSYTSMFASLYWGIF